MRLVLQRTSNAEVWIDGRQHARTEAGLLILFGTKTGDDSSSCRFLAEKAVNLRIFEDDAGKMNLSALDVSAEIMVVSQFTLYADCRKGRRPSYNEAMAPAQAEPLYLEFIERLRESGLEVASGIFGAKMDVRLSNSGPVTIILEHGI